MSRHRPWSMAGIGVPTHDEPIRTHSRRPLPVDLPIAVTLLTIAAVAAVLALPVLDAIRRAGMDVDEQFDTLVALAV